MDLTVGNVIDGVVRPIGQLTTDLVNPATGERVGSATLSRSAEVDEAMEAAAAAWQSWRRTTPRERQERLLHLASLIEENIDRILEAEVLLTGKPRQATLDFELRRAVDNIRFFAGALRVVPGAAQNEYAVGLTSSIRREPIGVIAQITPWNFPFMMAVWKIVPAIAAGNTVVLKPAETTPTSSVILAELAHIALPSGVMNVVLGDRDTGRLMVEHNRPAMVSLTGSTRAGSDVMRSAAPTVKRLHLELGGKAPAVVFADADIDYAARQIAEGAFWNGGQSCTAEARVLVDATVKDRFVDALLAATKQLRTGGPDDTTAFYGPVASQTQLDRVLRFFERLPRHARILTGGTSSGPGFFVDPTVIDGVNDDDEIVREEVFGPVLTVQSFTSEEEAVRLANSTPYGLAASVWTADQGRSARLSIEIDAGTVWVNCTQNIPSETPHGGFKSSGVGKDLSVYSLDDYSNIKHVLTAHR
ncbi:aldehyde dehydrogenase family protein [Herbiconiux sp. KACC 21604]|uniref:aldehyde dehydrogenase family protein n=1 Tax=unclassified Herbiconiux TaxID=2618217 RepID=UPI00149207F3|nr:aldehyde dehydrogenase family protein [Herbiconiux sp. SALV-R1]QJU53460.1 aldehyde dehydrogenase family protein [Herbiconiux sp. SALV-R1]WPO88432.1 aldehyde dehydrogenase family protein [Herbiconiux sp. KACC 21604]